MICDLVEIALNEHNERFVNCLIDLNFEFGRGEIIQVFEYVPAEQSSLGPMRYGHFITSKDKKFRWKTNGHTLFALKHSRILQ